MFFKNKLERLLERICVIVLCVITAVMAIPVKSVTAAGSASVVLEILHEGDTVNVKLEMVSNPGIAGMSFKLCYDSSLLSIVSVDETLDSFKSSIINPDGDGFVGYAYAQAKDCKDTGTMFSITFKINRENEKELTYESVYIDEFDACDSNLEDVNTDIKVQFSDKNAQNIQNKQNLQNTPEEQAGVKGQSDSKNNETLKDMNSNSGKHESISKDINGTEENSVSLIEINSSDTVKSTNVIIVIVIAVVVIAIVALLLLIKKKSGKTGGVKK
jgi:cohesin domain